MFRINNITSKESGTVMNTKDPHWTFYAEVLSRSIKDLEAACKAEPDSAEFAYLRNESPDIVDEAREALTALESFLRAYDQAMTATLTSRTQH